MISRISGRSHLVAVVQRGIEALLGEREQHRRRTVLELALYIINCVFIRSGADRSYHLLMKVRLHHHQVDTHTDHHQQMASIIL